MVNVVFDIKLCIPQEPSKMQIVNGNVFVVKMFAWQKNQNLASPRNLYKEQKKVLKRRAFLDFFKNKHIISNAPKLCDKSARNNKEG